MKYSKKIRGMSTALAFTFAFMVFSFSFAPKVHATLVEMPIQYGAVEYYQSNGALEDYIWYRIKDGTTSISNGQVQLFANGNICDAYIELDESTIFTGPVKLYASYYFYSKRPASYRMGVQGDVANKSTWDVTYTNSNGQTGYVSGGLDSYEPFTVTSSNAAYPTGYAMEASWTASEGHPITALRIRRADGLIGFTRGSVSNTDYFIYYPSIRVVGSAYSEELEALDKVADEIAAQSDILLAMKGDIVSILQDIYSMTGDMYEAQQILNGYIELLLPYVQNIDSNVANIYYLLSSQLALLETAINNAATTVQAAVEAQTAAMIAYLEEMFNTGNEVPSETYEQQQDAENILDQMESLEKPDVETIVPEIDDYSDGGVSGVMSAIFSSNLIVTMMTLSASLAFGAYVLFGKRG